jgi:hypothetical protein
VTNHSVAHVLKEALHLYASAINAVSEVINQVPALGYVTAYHRERRNILSIRDKLILSHQKLKSMCTDAMASCQLPSPTSLADGHPLKHKLVEWEDS